MLKLANLGTVADLEYETDELGCQRFLYVFLSFRASIKGFRQCRPVLVIDGTHLWGKYKGVLLTACGQDANFQVYPLAYAVVDSENKESWTWFLKKLERILGDSPKLTIISDRHKAIVLAIKTAYPLAVHIACIVHFSQNVASEFSIKGLYKLVTAYRLQNFTPIFNKIRSQSAACARYLEKAGMATWTRVYCKGERYNLMTSNVYEQLNKALKKGRGSPIVELLKFIQAMMTRWFSARRKKSLNHRGNVPPEVEIVMKQHLKEVTASRINPISDWSFEVVGKFGEKNVVML